MSDIEKKVAGKMIEGLFEEDKPKKPEADYGSWARRGGNIADMDDDLPWEVERAKSRDEWLRRSGNGHATTYPQRPYYQQQRVETVSIRGEGSYSLTPDDLADLIAVAHKVTRHTKFIDWLKMAGVYEWPVSPSGTEYEMAIKVFTEAKQAAYQK